MTAHFLSWENLLRMGKLSYFRNLLILMGSPPQASLKPEYGEHDRWQGEWLPKNAFHNELTGETGIFSAVELI